MSSRKESNMIPLFKVHHPKGIGEKIEKVFETGFISEGEYSDKFENSFGNFVCNDNTSLVNSCTSALSLAYSMSGIGPGDDVITTPMTCMATNEPIFNMGANLIFADIDPRTGNICPESVKKKLTKKTKAIVCVHWAGQPFEIDAINEIARNREIKVIEDAAHALGASYNNKVIGSHSDYVCFSFQAIKHLTTADGGAICSKSKYDDIKIKKMRWFGIDRKYSGSKWEQDITFSGFKYHMNNINAVIGLEQMKHIDGIIGAHKKNGLFFDQNIKNKNVNILERNDYSESSHWIYTVLVEDRDKFKMFLNDNGISSDVVHVRNDNYSIFKKFKSGDLLGADYFCNRMINIPVGWWLKESELEKIANTVNSYRG